MRGCGHEKSTGEGGSGDGGTHHLGIVVESLLLLVLLELRLELRLLVRNLIRDAVAVIVDGFRAPCLKPQLQLHLQGGDKQLHRVANDNLRHKYR